MSAPHPSNPGDLFTGLWEAAHWIWERRRVAARAGMAFSEETITETVLLDLATVFADKISILPFNKVQEGKVGADWEWCFYDDLAGQYLRMLMQAKVLDDKELAYSHLDRMVGNTGQRQIDVLAQTSADRGVPAFYVFYNHVSDQNRLDLPACHCVGGCIPCWGATVAPLEAVRVTPLDKTFDGLVKVMSPWACLACPSDWNIEGGAALLDRIALQIEGLQDRALERSGEVDVSVRRPHIERQAPDYLRQARWASRDAGGLDGRATLRRLAAENPQIDGVVMVDVGALDREAGGTD